MTQLRAVIYARYSATCSARRRSTTSSRSAGVTAQAQGWTVVGTYTDAALSGASRFRPGFQKLTGRCAASGAFEVVICEAVDRLGRRLADTADLQDTLAFHRLRLFTPSLGEVTPIHVGVHGHDGADVAEGSGREDQARPAGAGDEGQASPAGWPMATGSPRADGAGARADRRRRGQDRRADLPRVRGRQEPRGDGAGPQPERRAGPGGRPWSNTTIRGQADAAPAFSTTASIRRAGVEPLLLCEGPGNGKRVARPNAPDKWERTAGPGPCASSTMSSGRRRRTDRPKSAIAFGGRPASRRGQPHSLNARIGPVPAVGASQCGCCGGNYTIGQGPVRLLDQASLRHLRAPPASRASRSRTAFWRV